MSKQAVFTMKLESELRDEFMEEAEAMHRPASQLVRDFMRDFIDHQRQLREHDTWFKNQVQLSMKSNTQNIPHEQIMTKMKNRLQERLTQKDKK